MQPGATYSKKSPRSKSTLASPTPVVRCYEAGWVGFGLHRFLQVQGTTNSGVASSSMEVKRWRRAQCDGLDVRKLVSMLIPSA
jgi:transposase